MSYLYAVQMNIPNYPFHPIKVGFSADPETRIQKQYTGGPFPVEVLGIWKGSKEEERDIHVRYKAQRLTGEWFRPSAAFLSDIELRIERDDPYELPEDPNWKEKLTPEQREVLLQMEESEKRLASDPEYRKQQRELAAAIMERVLERPAVTAN